MRENIEFGFGLTSPAVAFYFEGETDGEGGGGSPRDIANEAIVAKLTGIEEGVRSQNQLNTLMAQPEIRAILEAKAAGRNVKIVDAVEDAAVVDEPLDEAEVESMSNTKLLKLFEDRLGKKLPRLFENAAKSVVERSIAPLAEQLQTLKGFANSTVEDKMKAEIAKAQAKYSDFDTMRPSMVDISNANPGLGAEELYLIAKARSGQQPVEKRGLTSERPRSIAAKPSSSDKVAPGAKGFAQLLARSQAKQDFSTFENR